MTTSEDQEQRDRLVRALEAIDCAMAAVSRACMHLRVAGRPRLYKAEAFKVLERDRKRIAKALG